MNVPVRREGDPLEPWRGPGPVRGLWDWNPLGEFERLWRELGRAFEQRQTAPAWGGGWIPAVEEDETDDAYVIRAELPGIPRENISVDVDDRELRISGELTEEQRERVLSHRGGRFFYRTTLPGDVDTDKIDAELTDGVLSVRLPKSGTAGRRRITIGGKD